jgi:hypothetical protein
VLNKKAALKIAASRFYSGENDSNTRKNVLASVNEEGRFLGGGSLRKR